MKKQLIILANFFLIGVLLMVKEVLSIEGEEFVSNNSNVNFIIEEPDF